MKSHTLYKSSCILLLSAILTKALSACFKIPLTSVLGGTGMGYYSCAYGLFLPVYALSVSGVSAGVSQCVSREAAFGNWATVHKLHRAARLGGAALGLTLCAFMLLLSAPFATFVAGQSEALPAILAICPAALFGCLTAVERGYYEGLQQMTPTAISQCVEALVKLALGLGLCLAVLRYPTQVCVWFPAEMPLYAIAAAAGVLGVTLSTLAGWLCLLCWNGKGKKPSFTPTSAAAQSVPTYGKLLRRLCYVMLPVAGYAALTQLTSLIDLMTVMSGLRRMQAEHSQVLELRYGAEVLAEEFPAFFYGAFTGMAVTVFGLAPSMTQCLGKAVLPAASCLGAKGEWTGLRQHTKQLLLLTAVTAIPAAWIMGRYAAVLLGLLYPTRPEEVALAAPSLTVMMPGMVGLCLATPLCSVLQGVGKAVYTVKAMLLCVGVKLVCNLVLVHIPELCLVGAGVSTSICYSLLAVLLGIGARRYVGRGEVRELEVRGLEVSGGAHCAPAAEQWWRAR